jgi:hypothetical protein
MEEHVGSVRPVGQISDLIDDENVRVRVGGQRFLEISTLAGVREDLIQCLDSMCAAKLRRFVDSFQSAA